MVASKVASALPPSAWKKHKNNRLQAILETRTILSSKNVHSTSNGIQEQEQLQPVKVQHGRE